jgi:hypothetical protein
MRWPILTSQEKQVVGFILFCLVLGVATKSYRANHPVTPAQSQQRHGEKLKK